MKLTLVNPFLIKQLIAAACITSAAYAATATWDSGATTQNWQDATNWNPDGLLGLTTDVYTNTDTAIFSTTGSGTINLGPRINIQNIQFGSGVGDANAFIIGDADDTLNLTTAGSVLMGTGVTTTQQMGLAGTTIKLSNVASSTYTFTNDSTTLAAKLNIAGNITTAAASGTSVLTLNGTNGGTVSGNITNGTGGLMGLTKSGAGTWTLTGTNTFTGGTTISDGTLQLGNNGTTGSLAGAIEINSPGKLSLYRSGAYVFNNAVSGTGIWELKGNGASLQGDYTIGGNNSSFSGNIQVTNARMALDNQTDLGTATVTVNSGGQLMLTGGTFTNAVSMTGNGWLETAGNLGALRFLGGATLSGAVTLTGDSRIHAHAAADTGAISGNIGGAFAIEKTGAGTITLSGTNTYTGTTVGAGTLQFAKKVSLNGGTLPSLANFTVASGATAAFNVGGAGEFTDTDITNLIALTNVGVGTATQGFLSGSKIGLDTTNAGGLFTYGNGITDHVSGGPTDTLGIVKLGTGTLKLTGTNTYTGTTTIAAGTLEFSSAADQTLTGAISGAGALTKSGAGTLTLTGVTSHTGGTTVDAGTLKLDFTSRGLGAPQFTLGTIAVNSTLELYNNTAVVSNNYNTGSSLPINTTFTGAGTITKKGVGIVDFYTSTNLNGFSGLIDVQEGLLGDQSGGITSGTASLNVASGAFFDLRTSNVSVNILTGLGTIASSHNTGGTGGTKTLTVGALGGTSTFDGVIQNSVPVASGGTAGGIIALTKAGAGTLTLTKASTYTGATTISGGILALSGVAGALTGATPITIGTGGSLKIDNALGANIGTRINDASAITLNGGTLQFANDTSAANFAETVGTITTSSTLGGTINTSQAASLQTSTLTITNLLGLTTTFSGTGLGVDARNKIVITGKAQGAIVGSFNTTQLALYDTTLGVTAAVHTDVPFGGTISDGAATNIRLTGGISGNVSLGSATTTVNTILQNQTDATVIDNASKTLRLGAAGGIVLPTGMASLTIGTAANSGTLTAGGAPTTAGTLNLINNSATSLLTINSAIANNGATVSLVTDGAGKVVLAGTNTYTGATTITGGTLEFSSSADQTLSGAVSGAGGLIKSGVGTLTFTGGSTYTGTTTVNAGTLKLRNPAAFVSASTVAGGNLTLAANGTSNVVASAAATVLLAGGSLTLSSETNNYLVLNGAMTASNAGGSTIFYQSAGGVSGSGAYLDGGLKGANQMVTIDVTGALAGSGVIFRNANNTMTGSLTVNGNGTGTATESGIALLGTVGTSLQGVDITLNSARLEMQGIVGDISWATGSASATIGALNGNANAIVHGVGTTLTVGATGNNGSFAGVISGTHNFTKTGAGIQTLSGANTYTGITTINGGVLEASTLANGSSASGIGQSTNVAANLVFGAPTATLRYTGSTAATTDRGFTLSSGTGGGATIEASGTSPTATLTIDNTVALNYGTTAQTRLLTLGGTNTGANTFAKVIANNTGATNLTSLTKAGVGTWVLSGANTYTGVTTISGGTLSVGTIDNGGVVSGNLGSATNAAGNLVIDGGTLQYTGALASTDRNFTIGTSGGTLDASGSGALTLTGAPTMSGTNTARTFTLTGTNTAGNTLQGIIGNNGTGATSLTKTGVGTWVLTGANTYTGGTTVNGGTLVVNAGNYTKDGSGRTTLGTMSVAPGATLDLINNGTAGSYASGQCLVIQNLTLSGTGTVKTSGTGVTDFWDGFAAVNLTAFTGTFHATSGTMSFQINAARMSGVNAMILDGGTYLDLRTDGGITVSSLTGTGTVGGSFTANQVLTVGATNATSQFDGVIQNTVPGFSNSPTIHLTKIGTGTLTLTGANTYTGVTTIRDGTLSVATIGNGGVASGNLGSATNAAGNLVINGGTLKYTGALASTDRNFTLGTSGGTLDASGSGALTFTGAPAMSGTNTARTFTLTGTNIDANTLQGIIGNNGSGATSLSKNGVGTWVLTGANTYTGGLSVNQGIVNYTGGGSVSGNGTVQIASGATLNLSGSANNQLETNGIITIAGTLAATTNVANTLRGTSIILNGGAINTTIANTSSWGAFLVNSAVAITANGTGNTISGTSVIGISSGNVLTLTTPLGGDTLSVTGSMGQGASGTAGGITKTGAGTVTFSGANTYTGPTTITAGTLSVTSLANGGSASGIGASANAASNLVINGGTLKFTGTTGNGSTNRLFTVGTNGATIDGSSSDNTALTFTNTGSIATTAGATDRTVTLTGSTAASTLNTFTSVVADPSGGGKTLLTKAGANTWVLAGANTYTGATTVSEGALVVNGSLSASSAVSVISKLYGTGTIGGATTILGSGTYSAGAQGDVGKQTFTTGITYDSGSIFEWNLAETPSTTGRGTNYDAVNAATLGATTGAIFRVVLNGSQDFSETFWNSDRTWSDIFKTADAGSALAIASIFSTIQYYNGSGVVSSPTATQGSFSLSGTTLTWTAVPEPTTALAGLLMGAGLLRRRRV